MKKLNQNGFAHLAVVAIAVVVGVVGFAGFKVYQNRQVSAKAASYKIVAQGNNLAFRACKRNATSVNIYAQNLSDSTVYFKGAIVAHSNSVSKIMTQGGAAVITSKGSGMSNALLYWMVDVNGLPVC